MKKERVVCPAVKFVIRYMNKEDDGTTIIVPFVKSRNEPHFEMIERMIKDDENVLIICKNEGFTTSDRSFVDPKEALKITDWGNQLRFRGITELTVEEFYRY